MCRILPHHVKVSPTQDPSKFTKFAQLAWGPREIAAIRVEPIPLRKRDKVSTQFAGAPWEEDIPNLLQKMTLHNAPTVIHACRPVDGATKEVAQAAFQDPAFH